MFWVWSFYIHLKLRDLVHLFLVHQIALYVFPALWIALLIVSLLKLGFSCVERTPIFLSELVLKITL
jgi:hypothetical protein